MGRCLKELLESVTKKNNLSESLKVQKDRYYVADAVFYFRRFLLNSKVDRIYHDQIDDQIGDQITPGDQIDDHTPTATKM